MIIIIIDSFRATSVIVSGTHYKLGCVLALRIENDKPVFGIVESIYINEKMLFSLCLLLS